MRVKYYKRLFGQMSYKKPFVFIIITVLFLIMIYSYFINQISPTIKTLCDTKAKAIALQVTTETVREYITELKYENLIHVQTEEGGRITGLNADVVEMNKLSTRIAYRIQEKIIDVEDVEIKVPIGKLLGWSIFSGYGPKIKIKVMPTGTVNVDFKTEFKSEGINQTRHRIYIEVKSNVRTVAPFVSDVTGFQENVTVAETVIVGEIPDTYYNIEGMKELTVNDTLNLTK